MAVSTSEDGSGSAVTVLGVTVTAASVRKGGLLMEINCVLWICRGKHSGRRTESKMLTALDLELQLSC